MVTTEDYKMLPSHVLAYIGDAIYEVYVRKHLIDSGLTKGSELQHQSKNFVSAPAQAARLRKIQDMLSVAEQDIIRRGRNVKTGTTPKTASIMDYRHSTGLEALIGHLYLQRQHQRMEEIVMAVLAVDVERGEYGC